jgi:hypothetical protein
MGSGTVTGVSNPETNDIAVTDTFLELNDSLDSNSQCTDWLNQGFQSSGVSGNLPPGTTLQSFMQNILPGLVVAGSFQGSGANNVNGIYGGGLNSALPPGSVIAINTNGAFFNALQPGQSVGASNNYQQQINAIIGGTGQARGFIMIHEIAHLFNLIQPDAGNQSSNQATNNDAIWKNCGSLIQSLSNKHAN